jgi:mRNA-degrading endonuclease toxin of MazEF toxin-antitoxin module
LSLKDAFAKAGIYPTINPGEVWKASDSSISLIDKLTRHWHEERYCVILSNKEMCSDPEWPLVLIAPLTHQLYPKPKPDLIIDTTDKNGLEVKSRLILSQIQTIRKTDLQQRLGEISISKWEQVMRYIFWHIDR